VLHPVNDYVREFTVDVAKGRHARVGSMMQEGGDLPSVGPDDPKLRVGMTLDAALAKCMAMYEPVPVWDDDENIVGSVNPQDLAAALQVDTAPDKRAEQTTSQQ